MVMGGLKYLWFLSFEILNDWPLPFCWNCKTNKAVSKDAREDEDTKERAQPVVRGPRGHLDKDDDEGGGDGDDGDDDDGDGGDGDKD